MNKVLKSMKNFPFETVSHPQLRLEAFRFTTLSSFLWNDLCLTGHFWRFYWNSAPGAGLVVGEETVELLPDRFYVIPPECGLRTWCRAEAHPRQFYVHFEISRLTGAASFSCRGLKPLPGDMKLLGRILTMLENDPASPLLYLLISALVSGTAARLEPEDFDLLPSDSLIDGICARLRETPGADWSVEQLAREAALSVNGFLEKFHSATGFSPYRYILNLRYSLAARLLTETEETIDAISAHVGFRDRFHFSREFKKLYGLPPAAYRRAYSHPEAE